MVDEPSDVPFNVADASAEVETLRMLGSTQPSEHGGRWVSQKELRRRMVGSVALGLAACAGTFMVGWLALDQGARLDRSNATSACRSELAAAADVAAGGLNINLARLVDQIATGTPAQVDAAVAELRTASDALEAALDARAQTDTLCN